MFQYYCEIIYQGIIEEHDGKFNFKFENRNLLFNSLGFSLQALNSIFLITFGRFSQLSKIQNFLQYYPASLVISNECDGQFS